MKKNSCYKWVDSHIRDKVKVALEALRLCYVKIVKLSY